MPGRVGRPRFMREEKNKGSWKDALKYALCAALLATAWLLFQRHLGPELRESLANPRKAFLFTPRE